MPSSRGLQQILIAARYVICAIQVISPFGNSYVQETSVQYNVIAQLYHSYYKENERTWGQHCNLPFFQLLAIALSLSLCSNFSHQTTTMLVSRLDNYEKEAYYFKQETFLPIDEILSLPICETLSLPIDKA